jgi:hypothetical protein
MRCRAVPTCLPKGRLMATIETRLRKLEARSVSPRRRTFVFGEVGPGEARLHELLAAGVAHEDDLFIFTGVPQSDPSSYRGRMLGVRNRTPHFQAYTGGSFAPLPPRRRHLM